MLLPAAAPAGDMGLVGREVGGGEMGVGGGAEGLEGRRARASSSSASASMPEPEPLFEASSSSSSQESARGAGAGFRGFEEEDVVVVVVDEVSREREEREERVLFRSAGGVSWDWFRKGREGRAMEGRDGIRDDGPCGVCEDIAVLYSWW